MANMEVEVGKDAYPLQNTKTQSSIAEADRIEDQLQNCADYPLRSIVNGRLIAACVAGACVAFLNGYDMIVVGPVAGLPVFVSISCGPGQA